MIDIDSAIRESKNKQNISDGGSKCFDFKDVVLVRYTNYLKYLKNGNHAREKSEEIMEAVNKKVDKGVNTPRHIAVKRQVEGDEDVCYVLQEKCPGVNCASKSKYGVSFDEMYESLKFIFNIPFEHYQKLIADGFELFEMGYEAKNKNLFYDLDSGFWYIDFLDNEKDYVFDPNDIKKVFEALNYRIPKIVNIASYTRYDEKLTEEQQTIKNELTYAIEAKTLLAIKSLLPNFERYEKFFLLDKSDDYKKYLMKKNIVNKDLINIDSDDYEVFDELYEITLNILIDKVVNKGVSFWNIDVNDIRNDSLLFKLQTFFEKSKYNSLNKEDFSDSYIYERKCKELYSQTVLLDLTKRLKKLEPNDNINRFLLDLETKKQSNKKIK